MRHCRQPPCRWIQQSYPIGLPTSLDHEDGAERQSGATHSFDLRGSSPLRALPSRLSASLLVLGEQLVAHEGRVARVRDRGVPRSTARGPLWSTMILVAGARHGREAVRDDDGSIRVSCVERRLHACPGRGSRAAVIGCAPPASRFRLFFCVYVRDTRKAEGGVLPCLRNRVGDPAKPRGENIANALPAQPAYYTLFLYP